MTPYGEVYERFLSKIKDYPMLDLIEKDADFVESMLEDYLNGAIALFTYGSEAKLNGRNHEDKTFGGELSRLEIEILAKFMLVEYLSPKLINSNLIESNLSSKDFNNFSSANLILQIGEIQKREREQADNLLIENYYRNGSL